MYRARTPGALLTRTPYGKHGYFHHDFVSAVTAAREGYAVVIQDTRGRFASEGDYAFGMPEGDDSYDAVEWVASQPWCDGAVGMYGASYGGRVQWEAAMERPPSLRAIAPTISASPVADLTRAGVVPFEMMVGWLAMMTASMIERAERAAFVLEGARAREKASPEYGNGVVADLRHGHILHACLLYTSPSPRDRTRSRMPSSA